MSPAALWSVEEGDVFGTPRCRDVRLLERADQLQELRRSLGRAEPRSVVVRGASGSGRTRLVREVLAGDPDVLYLCGRPIPPDGGRTHRVGLPVDRRLGVVVIDDADHLDTKAAEALANDLAATSASIVLIAVSEASIPRGITEIGEVATVIDVPLLSRDASEMTIDAMFERPVDLDARGRLVRLGDGNPGYLRALVDDALARQQLREGSDGVMRLAPGYQPAAEVLAPVRECIEGVSATARSVLARLVLAGSLPIGSLGRVASPASFTELQVAGLARLDEGATVVVPRLVRHTVEAGLTAEERGVIARELLDVIGARHPDRCVLAGWHLAAGSTSAGEVLLAGARIAQERLDHVLARALASAAQADAAPGERGAELRLAQLDAEGSGRTSQGLARYSSLAADPVTSREDAASAVVGRAAGLLVGGADPVRARRTAVAGCRAYPDLHAGGEARALAALCDLLLGDVQGAVARLEGATTAGSPSSAITPGGIQALALVLAGDLAAAERCVSEVTALRSLHPDHHVPIWAEPAPDLATVLLDAYRGRLDAANAMAARHLRQAARRGRRPTTALWHVVTGHLAVLAGDLDVADRAGADALAAAHGYDPYGIRVVATGLRALVAAQRGSVHLATEQLRELDALGVGSHAWLAVDRRRVHAWIAYHVGRSRAATDLAIEAGELALAAGSPVWAAVAFDDVCRFGHPDLARAGAEVAAQRCDDGLPRILAGARDERIGDDPGRAVGDRLFAAGLRLCAAEAWLAGAEETEAHDRVAAERLRRRAGTVLAPTEVLPPTVAAAIVEVPTEREQEVVSLVATGLTSAAVAAHLRLSVRTVDNHVARALRRLGADDRWDLAWLLGVPRDPVQGPPATSAPDHAVDATEAARLRRGGLPRNRRTSVRRATVRGRTPRPDPAHV